MYLNPLQIMKSKKKKPHEESFDTMMIPHWTHYLTPGDVSTLNAIATSKRLSGNLSKKIELIKTIMSSRGFVRLAGGTNRIVFRYLEDPRFVAKVAIDSVGLKDNPAEYSNQWLLRPFCSKMFWCTDCGTVGFSERVIPITSVEEFKIIAGDVFDVIYYVILGRYVMEDIGTDYFMNWGIRAGFGPVLLDYPYLYELEGCRLFCSNDLPDGTKCRGEIDYDYGINHLYCKKCGRKYLASELKKDILYNRVIRSKGGQIPMNITIKAGNRIIGHSNNCDYIVNNSSSRKEVEAQVSGSTMKVAIRKNGITYDTDSIDKIPKSNSPIKLSPEEIMMQIRKNTQELSTKKSADENEKNDSNITSNKEYKLPKEEDITQFVELPSIEGFVKEDNKATKEEQEEDNSSTKIMHVSDNIEVNDEVKIASNNHQVVNKDSKGRFISNRKKISASSMFIPDEGDY